MTVVCRLELGAWLRETWLLLAGDLASGAVAVVVASGICCFSASTVTPESQ